MRSVVLFLIWISFTRRIHSDNTSKCQCKHTNQSYYRPENANGCCDYDYCLRHSSECSTAAWQGYVGRTECGPCGPGGVPKAYFDRDCHYTCTCDYCMGSPCAEGASCISFSFGFRCVCPEGYYGVLCNINYCASSPCAKGTTCTSLSDGFRCVCPEGYYGVLCDRNYCTSSPCAVGATCISLNDAFRCVCPEGYYGVLCNTNYCASSPCAEGATCRGLSDGFRCVCPAGYHGLLCDTNYCASSPCHEGATCRGLSDGFRCVCPAGYHGLLCDTNYCASSPCAEGATCRGLSDGFRCVCPAGYHGLLCDTNYCASSPCAKGATCTSLSHGFRCVCPEGYYGVLCETNYCASSPCAEGATCTGLSDGFRCVCPEGYYGVLCDINYCASSPCHEGATCTSLSDSFRCVCPEGYYGVLCDINYCSSSPCAEGATCISFSDGFRCVCPEEYYGVLCDTNVCHPTPADVVFLLDSSFSMTEKQFRKQLDFVANFTDHVFIGVEDFQISVVTFSFDAHIEFYLNEFTTKELIKDALQKIIYKPGATFTHKALEKILTVFNSFNGGGRRINGTLPGRFVFLLTDGMSSYKLESKKMATNLKTIYKYGFQIQVIGIGNEVSHEELLDIASAPSLVYSVEDFDSLYTVLKRLVQISCKACNHSSATDVAMFVETTYGTDLSQFDEARDALTHVIQMVDSEESSTQISLTSIDGDFSPIFSFLNHKNKDKMLLDINKLQLSDIDKGVLNVEDILFYIDSTPFKDARKSSKKLVILFTNGQFQTKNEGVIKELKQSLLLKNITTVIVVIGQNINEDVIYSIVNDAFDVYLLNLERKYNLNALKSYMTYSVCSIEE